MKQITVALGDEEAERLERILRSKNLTSYAFAKDAILEKMRDFHEEDPEKASAVVEEMIELLTERKRYIYQMGPYSDQNHRDWLEGRFPQATKREIIDAVAKWRAAGGKT